MKPAPFPPRAWRARVPGAALGVLLLIGGSGGAQPQASRVLVVTSDTGAYCRSLSALLAAHGKLPREASDLKAQGDGMCDQGQVRGGIARLRRALVVLNRRAGPQRR